ncbi:AraC family transcriptional regulator [Aquabacterium sp.]|uniref:AraC family transcriptional regulator n=1 Tax=Aquabacterium sp. TaxID=1872578 RepID=UPI002486E1A3|nr:AraC family transcriptional regulator [Aquabacterium sp.]MDI1259450.1 AraC family transcriptional regulator [Aquabacterium sp.]
MVHNAQQTVLASWARVIRRTLDVSGCDSTPLLIEAGLSNAMLDDPNGRCPAQAMARLWRLSAQATGDDAFGLKAARQVMPTSFHALWQAQSASQTLKDAFERVARHFRVVTEAWSLSFTPQGDEHIVRLLAPASGIPPEPEAIDAAAALVVYTARLLLGNRAVAPTRVELQRAVPLNADAYARTFRCPVSFNAEGNLIAWPSALMDTRLEGANPELARHSEALLTTYLAGVHKENTVAQVRACLTNLLPRGEPSQTQVAQQLNCSVRTLQRRLSDQQTSFTDLLDQTRQALALSHLADPACSISEVAYLLGFADTSNFTRAFRRWTGQSPTEHRRASGLPG